MCVRTSVELAKQEQTGDRGRARSNAEKCKMDLVILVRLTYPDATARLRTSRVHCAEWRGRVWSMCDRCKKDPLKGQRLLTCSTCNYAHYCGSECQVGGTHTYVGRMKECTPCIHERMHEHMRAVRCDGERVQVAASYSCWLLQSMKHSLT
jgi:hypothetical protein